MEIKVKLYKSWHTWKSKKEAMDTLLDWMYCSEGAERDRYMNAYFDIEAGETIVDTDA